MLENGILPRTHASLKLRDNPGNFRSRHSPLCEDTLIAQIECRTTNIQLFILLLGFFVESNHWERVLRFGNGEKSISKLSVESWVFHSDVHHFAHVHREQSSVVVVIFDTYITNAMLWIVDDNGITRYTKCSAFQKCLIKALCVINVLRSAPNVVLLTRMTLNVTFKTSCWPLMSKCLLPLNLSLRRNHIMWYYMIWLCFRPFWPLRDLYHVTLTSDQLKIIIFELGTPEYNNLDTNTTNLTPIQLYIFYLWPFWIYAN